MYIGCMLIGGIACIGTIYPVIDKGECRYKFNLIYSEHASFANCDKYILKGMTIETQEHTQKKKQNSWSVEVSWTILACCGQCCLSSNPDIIFKSSRNSEAKGDILRPPRFGKSWNSLNDYKKNRNINYTVVKYRERWEVLRPLHSTSACRCSVK